MSGQEEQDHGIGQAALDTLVADILAQRVSIIEVMRSAPAGDYRAFVQQARLSMLLMRDRRLLPLLMTEMRAKLVEAGVDPDNDEIEKELARKDGKRRFPKLVEERARAVNTQPPLLTATTFEKRLEQYKVLLGHVEPQWADACTLYQRGNFPIAAFLSILVIEEVGKLSRLAEEMIYFDGPATSPVAKVIERSHRRKHFIGVVSGALMNARLDRVLGKDKVRRILHGAESDELEKARQACLYIDVEDGKTVVPSARISQERARDLTILAGELMAEVLGYFPWEFERMMESVIEFERAIGMSEEKIAWR
jgi:AbiV family abortive infection protein